MLSVGVPMMLGGDELGHSQKGNNNTYCQDNELTWLDWELDDRQAGVPGIHQEADLHLEDPAGLPAPEVLPRPGHPRLGRSRTSRSSARRARRCRTSDWNAGFVKCLGVRLAGDLINDENERGEPIVGETLLILLERPLGADPVHLAADHATGISGSGSWIRRTRARVDRAFEEGSEYPLQDRSLVVLVTRTPEDKGQTVTPAEAKAAVLRRRRPRSRDTPPGPVADLSIGVSVERRRHPRREPMP